MGRQRRLHTDGQHDRDSGAAPIWAQFMQNAVPFVSNGHPSPFVRPAGIVEKVICSLSGTAPSPGCKGGQRTAVFASDQPPLPASQDMRREIPLDTCTGLEASPESGPHYLLNH